MKLTKKMIIGALTGALTLGMAFTAMAGSLGYGQWCDEGTADPAHRYWFTIEPDGSRFLANTWHWVKDSDGVVRCYYFDEKGWLVTDTVIDGCTIDKDGHWTVNGIVQTSPDKDYYAHSDGFIGSKPAAETKTAEPKAAEPSAVKSASDKTIAKPKTAGGTSSKAYKTNTGGPGDSVDALEYEISAVSGQQVTNNWANFTMSFENAAQKITSGDVETRFDFMADYNGATLTVKYVPLSFYGVSGIDAFVEKYAKDAKNGVKDGTIAGVQTFGPYTFKKITKKVADPMGSMTDTNYLRIVDGTSYVQVIMVQHNGEPFDFTSALNTMKKVR